MNATGNVRIAYNRQTGTVSSAVATGRRAEDKAILSRPPALHETRQRKQREMSISRGKFFGDDLESRWELVSIVVVENRNRN